jgi:O-antigen ligase
LKDATLQAVLTALAALAAAVALILLLSATPLIRLTVGGGIALALILLFSGNARLACLYGLVLAAPLSLGKNFLVNPHMGGALSFRIDLVDFFVAALLASQLHDLLVGRLRWRAVRIPRVAGPWIVLMLLGGIFVAFGPFRSLSAMEIFRMLKCLLLFLVLLNEVRRIKRVGHVLAALMLGVLLQAAVGLTQYALNRQLGLEALGEGSMESVVTTSRGTLVTREFVNRVGGLLGNSNVLGVFLAALLPLGLSLLFTQVDVRLRALCLVTVVAGTVTLLVTLSRTAWAGFGVAAVGVLVLGTLDRRTRERQALKRGLTVAMIGLLLLSFSKPIMLRLFYSDREALRSRMEWVGVAWRMVKDKPVVGHGLNTYVFQQAPYTKYRNLSGLQKKYGSKLLPVVHNNYMLVWVEQGTLGLLAFLALQVLIIRVGLRNVRVQHETLFAVNVGALCGLVAMMMDWLASFSLRIDVTTRMYWILVALVFAVDYWRRENALPRRDVPQLAPTPQRVGAAA